MLKLAGLAELRYVFGILSAHIDLLSAYYHARVPSRRGLADMTIRSGHSRRREEPLRAWRASPTISACLRREQIERQPFSCQRPANCQKASRDSYPRWGRVFACAGFCAEAGNRSSPVCWSNQLRKRNESDAGRIRWIAGLRAMPPEHLRSVRQNENGAFDEAGYA